MSYRLHLKQQDLSLKVTKNWHMQLRQMSSFDE